MTPSFPLCSREEKVCKMSFLIFSSPCGFLKAKQKSEVNNSPFFSTFLSVCHKQTKLQSRSRLRASEAAVHEGHGGPAVPAEPAQHHPEEVRGGREEGRLLPVSESFPIHPPNTSHPHLPGPPSKGPVFQFFSRLCICAVCVSAPPAGFSWGRYHCLLLRAHSLSRLKGADFLH